MGRNIEIPTPRVFAPLLAPARYKGAHGGRGSGKSHFFAELLVEDALRFPGDNGGDGMRAVCIREVQRTLKESSKRLLEDKLQALGLGDSDGFKVFNEVIQTPGDGLINFSGMQDHTAESIKSLEGFSRAWIEEAQSLSSRSLSLLRPTIRMEGSEIWASWNPRRRTDPIDALLRGATLPTGAVVVQANWRDNPNFPSVLEQERLDCLANDPGQYAHIWEGDYATVLEGAYFAADLQKARDQGRIGRVAADPLMTIRLFVDIGGTGAKADAFTIWAAQFIGKEIRVLDYYEAVGQPLAYHLEWCRSKDYTPQRAQFWLPHDGASNDKVYDVSYQSSLSKAGYGVTVVANQGKGAAKARIEAARRLFPAMWFNESTTDAGRAALGWYHEKRDAARNIGLGPEHDWASHGADSFGLMCVAYEEQSVARTPSGPRYQGAGGWMG
jgi:phage terminase large subunit